MVGSLAVDRLDDTDLAAGRSRADAGLDDRAEAFRRLVGGELDRAYRLAAVILRDRFDAEDAVHDAAVSAWTRWRDLREPDRFEAWFGRILVNTCRDRLRRRRRRRVEVGDAIPSSALPVTPGPSQQAEQRDAVRRGMDRLSADERIAIVLRYEADLTVPDIARLVGVPQGTVKSRLHHALAKLRVALEEADR